MLPARDRVRLAHDFKTAFRSGNRAGSRVLVVHAAAADTESHAARVGFVVSKAVGNAVVRNRTKRRLREIARRHLPQLPPGLYVVRALPAAAGADFATLEQAFLHTARKASVKMAPVAQADQQRTRDPVRW